MRVRIYPDALHIDDHDPALSEGELSVGKRFWSAWRSAETEAEKRGTLEWLKTQLPVRRAAWVAKSTKRRPNAVETTSEPRPAKAACLPERWAVVGFTRDESGELEQRFTETSKTVRADLAVGLDLPAIDGNEDPVQELFEGDLEWMVDFEEAEAAGMAVTIDLSAYGDVGRTGLAALLVCGVSNLDSEQGASAMSELFSAHHYSDGLGFALQGVATNNTDEADAAWSAKELDPIEFLERELVSGPGSSKQRSNAGRTQKALGLLDRKLLSRTDNGYVDEESAQAAMNRALWPVTWGQYFSKLLAGESGKSAVPVDARRDFKRRFLNDVRGGAALPSLRVGSQPYGILPVRYSYSPSQWADKSPWFENTLLSLRAPWQKAAGETVPRLDPVLGASGGVADNSPESVLTEILTTLPHAQRFLVRKLQNWREEESGGMSFGDIFVALAAPFLVLDDPQFGHEALSILGRWGWARELLSNEEYLALGLSEVDALDGGNLSGTDAQLEALQDLRGRIGSLISGSENRDSARAWIDSMVTLVEQYAARMEPLPSLVGSMLDCKGYIANDVDDPKLFYSLYEADTETAEFELPLVASNSSSSQGYLESLANRVPSASTMPQGLGQVDLSLLPGVVLPAGLSTRIGGSRSRLAKRSSVGGSSQLSSVASHPAGGFEAPVLGGVAAPSGTLAPDDDGLSDEFYGTAPLLYQLLDGIVEDVSESEGVKYKQALAILGALSEDELELRMCETLGLASHRLDAYFTSMARKRLDALRKQKSGLQLGAFGWVMDLAPDEKAALDSQGFVHAPSLQQATTAAILRSGWSVHGTESERSTMAVDLSGERVRAAAWLLDGIRQGQELGELLGYWLERSIHDAGRDVWIDPLRRAALRHRGRSHEPRGPVDGLAILEAYGDASQDVAALVDAELTASEQVVLEGFLDGLLALFDAVDDAAVCESVHQVAQGNHARATAILDAVNQGDLTPPELESARTHMPGAGVVHRTLLLLGETSSDQGWSLDSPRGLFDPMLEAWAQAAMGAPSSVAIQVRTRSSGSAPWRPISLADLELSALDLVFDGPEAKLGHDSRWARRIAARLRLMSPTDFPMDAPIEINFSAPIPGGQITLSELAEQARAVRALITGSRPLLPADLELPGAEVSDRRNFAEAKTRVDALENSFRLAAASVVDLAAANDPTIDVGDILLVLDQVAAFDIPGALPASLVAGSTSSADSLGEQAAAIAVVLQSRLALLDGMKSGDESNAWSKLEARLQVVLGRPFPLLPRFTRGDDLESAFEVGEQLIEGDQDAIWSHLAGVARVRTGTARLDELGQWMELFGRGTPALRVAQLPHQEGDGWVARELPAPDTGGRVHWLVHDLDGGRESQVGGLVVDEWTERIPASEVTTGVAFHFDAPSSRPPQALLLAVTPEDEPEWSLDLVMATLLQTIELAKMRAAGPQAIEAYGHHLPAIFSPKDLRPKGGA